MLCIMIQSGDGQGMAKFVILEIIWRTFLHVYLAYGAHFRLTDYEASAPPRATLPLLAPVSVDLENSPHLRSRVESRPAGLFNVCPIPPRMCSKLCLQLDTGVRSSAKRVTAWRRDLFRTLIQSGKVTSNTSRFISLKSRVISHVCYFHQPQH
jgi:hypothetical protein